MASARVWLWPGFTASVIGALGLLAVSVSALAQAGPSAAPSVAQGYAADGPCQVSVETGAWTDQARSRVVPWLMRLPQGCGAGPFPVVVISHGLGGSREGLARFSQHLASHGYITVHPQHAGSDTGIWQGRTPARGAIDMEALRALLARPETTLNRFADIPFTVRQLQALNRSGPLRGKLDLARMAMAGHSFGALTTQAMAGQRFEGGRQFPAPRFRAFIAMSPSPSRTGDDRAAFADLRGPILFMTGTEDSFAVSAAITTAADRRKPFDALPATAKAIFVNLTGGDHFVFDGRALTGAPRPTDARHQAIINTASLAFLDATLKADPAALRFATGGPLAADAAPDATVEVTGW